MTREGSLAAATALTLVALLAGCSDGSAWYTPSTPTITVRVADGCPATSGRARDVEARDPGDGSLVPTDMAPVAGLVCVYSGPLNPSRSHLFRRLNAAQAQQITAALQKVSLVRPTGNVNCPADIGTVAILAFAYAHHPDVDLWWNTTGCESIDNGRVESSGLLSKSFGRFEAAFDEAASLPSGPRLPGR
jgi:hypothetical protein